MTQALRPFKSRGPLTRRLQCIAGGLAVIALCAAVRISTTEPDAAEAGSPVKLFTTKPSAKVAAEAKESEAANQAKPQIVAIVNGEKITRNDLAAEALLHYGDEVLEMLVNKHLILEGCKQRNVQVTQEEVSNEIDRMSERFGVATDQWLKMLKEERGISPQQYARDIIWPTIALRKLAADRVHPTEQEIQEAYDTQFGPAVQVRLIVCSALDKARKIHEMAIKTPEDFGNLAKQYSDDTSSASAKGLIQPIRRHTGDPNIERIAFALQPGQVSEIVAVGSDYAFVRCEKQLPARGVELASVRKLLEDACRDKKMRVAGAEIFKELQAASTVENIFRDPVKREQMPGVAVIINGKRVTMLDLSEECIERHGQPSLEGTINRKLIEQAARVGKIEVAEQDIDEEIAHAAEQMGRFKSDGTVDVETWLQEVQQEQHTTIELYRRDAVWPSVVLKKLVAARVDVTVEDLRRGYDANWGQCKQCRAIVFNANQQRRAQEVWDMARTKPTIENFGDLAEEYSVEASSRVLRGEVPPIPRHGGQPILEKEAFQLKAGELSGVFQLADKWVILFCEGDLNRQDKAPTFEEVRGEIYDDVYEKKLRREMAKEFASIQEQAQIDNFYAGTSKSPTKGQSIDSIAAPGFGGSKSARTAAASVDTDRQ